MFDEMYVKPSLRFRGGHIIGESSDDPQQPRVRFWQSCWNLLWHGNVLWSIWSLCTNWRVNFRMSSCALPWKSFMNVVEKFWLLFPIMRPWTEIATFGSETKQIILGWKNPCDSQRPLYLLHDSVHLLKCVRSNWIIEKGKEIELHRIEFALFYTCG